MTQREKDILISNIMTMMSDINALKGLVPYKHHDARSDLQRSISYLRDAKEHIEDIELTPEPKTVVEELEKLTSEFLDRNPGAIISKILVPISKADSWILEGVKAGTGAFVNTMHMTLFSGGPYMVSTWDGPNYKLMIELAPGNSFPVEILPETENPGT